MIARIAKAMEERDTLLPCQACNGEGSKLVEIGTSYRKVECKWCSRGFVDKETAKMFRRWERILKVNRGACS